MVFKCNKCNKIFTNNRNKDNHINKKICGKYGTKKIMNGKTRFLCEYCNKTFSRNYYLQIHINKLHYEEDLIAKIKDELKDELKNELKNELNNELNASYSQVNVEQINIDKQLNVGGDYNNINNTNNVVIQVNAFDKTSLDHIDDKLIYKAFVNLYNYLPQILAESNFSKDHPENHNVYLKNVKNKIYKVFDGLGYQEVNENVFFKHFIDNFLNLLDSHVSKLIEEDKINSDDKKFENFEEKCSELEGYAGEHMYNLKKVPKYKKLYDSLLNVFTSSKDMIKDSMNNKNHNLNSGELIELEYKDEKVDKKYIIS